jgi:hypothetical protein
MTFKTQASQILLHMFEEEEQTLQQNPEARWHVSLD